MLPAMAFSKIDGIRRRPAKAVFSNQPSEFAAREQASAQVVQPDRLAKRLQRADRIRRLGVRCCVRFRLRRRRMG